MHASTFCILCKIVYAANTTVVNNVNIMIGNLFFV